MEYHSATKSTRVIRHLSREYTEDPAPPLIQRDCHKLCTVAPRWQKGCSSKYEEEPADGLRTGSFLCAEGTPFTGCLVPCPLPGAINRVGVGVTPATLAWVARAEHRAAFSLLSHW